MMIYIFQMKKVRLREVQRLACGHTAQSMEVLAEAQMDLGPGSLANVSRAAEAVRPWAGTRGGGRLRLRKGVES